MTKDWREVERLHIAVQDGSLDLVKQLIATGDDLNRFDEGLSLTPLHYAAQHELLDIASLLIASGADVNAHDESRIGETPLGHVAASCSYQMAKLLVDAGADPTILGWMRITALDRSAERKKPEGRKVYELLLAVARKRFKYAVQQGVPARGIGSGTGRAKRRARPVPGPRRR